MARLFICTLGTSIANRCPSLRELQKENSPWDASITDKMKQFERELKENLESIARKKSDLEKSSAEITVLTKAKITAGDRVVLLATDTYLGKKCSEALEHLLEKQFNVSDVKTCRIKGLQVHSEEQLLKEGLSNFINETRRLIEEVGDYGTEIFLCPNGGFKGVVPFLTILGMRYHCKVLYTFELAESLIVLPSLPFTLDTTLYRRAERALKVLNEVIEQSEEVYLKNIDDYDESERDLFLGFVERNNMGMVTPSSMLEPLLEAAKTSFSVMLSKDAIARMEKLEGDYAYGRLVELMAKAQNKQWLDTKEHRHSLETTNLMAVKPGANVTERLLGYEREGEFWVTHVFPDHDSYDSATSGSKVPQKQDYPPEAFERWTPRELTSVKAGRLFESLHEQLKELEAGCEEFIKKNDAQAVQFKQALEKAQAELDKKDADYIALKETHETTKKTLIPSYLKEISLGSLLKAWWTARH